MEIDSKNKVGENFMARTVGIGLQDFKKIRKQNVFLVDKTMFIKEWWENKDDVTLITRPRRFGKTLTLSMVEQYFSVHNAATDIFQGMEIWNDEYYQQLQGTYPVIALSFADIKERSYLQARKKIGECIVDIYNKYDYLADGNVLNDKEKAYFHSISSDMEDYEISISLRRLSNYLYKYYKKNVIILLDEYDTPMQESYITGYWEPLTSFTRNLFNATFKSNPYLERAIMTGITRVSKESIFSDLNNLKVVTTTSEEYAKCFGFTEKEVIEALTEYGLSDKIDEIKLWYDGFTFGEVYDIYNPWSIINFLDKGRIGPYWTNTSSNSLVSNVIRQGSKQIKESFEILLSGKSITTKINEQIVYDKLDIDESAIWSLLLASGYLKIARYKASPASITDWKELYELEITNLEVMIMFRNLVQDWFASTASNYNDFIQALLKDDIAAMNIYMNRIALATFSFFDSGNKPSAESEPERFYHGFVLGLMVELEDRYIITSNRESGFGRYDVMLEPKDRQGIPMILEFKVQESKENELADTAQAALCQIDKRNYTSYLEMKGFCKEKVRKYGFAFQGKKVLIAGGFDGGLLN